MVDLLVIFAYGAILVCMGYFCLLVSLFLIALFFRKKWRRQSWQGVVIGKHIKTYGPDIEVCYDQRIRKINWWQHYPEEVWNSIEVGDYIIKVRGNDLIEKRAIQEEELREARHILTQRLSHEKEAIFQTHSQYPHSPKQQTVLALAKLAKATWQKQAWEGVVIGKYRTYYRRRPQIEVYVIELCYNQAVKEVDWHWPSDYPEVWKSSSYSIKMWESVKIGYYVIKKSGNASIEKRAIQEEEARDAAHVLIQRLSHAKKEIRSRAAEALRQIGTPEAKEAAEK